MIYKIINHSGNQRKDNILLLIEEDLIGDKISIGDILTYDKYIGEEFEVLLTLENTICIKLPENFDLKYIKPGTYLYKKY